MTRPLSAVNSTVFNFTLALTVCLFSSFFATEAVGKPVKNSTPVTNTPAPAVVSLDDYGAIGDGIANDSPALQLALDDLAANGGGTLRVPSGRYRLGTTVNRQFAPGLSLTIEGVPSATPIVVAGNGLGLDLTSEFIVAVGDANEAIRLTGLQNLLMKDVAFVGVLDVMTDAKRVLVLSEINRATIRHCEFYGLLTLVVGGAIISTHLTDLVIEQTAFLGCGANSAINTPVVRSTTWLGIEIRDCKFIDYGNRPDFFTKTSFQPPYSWIMVGDPAELEPAQSRREAIVDNVFLDEGAYIQLAVRPELFSAGQIPFEVYLSRVNMNVNNLFSAGIYAVGAKKLFIDRSNFGWSERAGFAIFIINVGDAIFDLIHTSADATRLFASAQRLTVLNSVYTSLESVGPVTNVINTDTPQEDPAQFVRQRYREVLNRDPDAAGHYYWTDKLLRCEGAECVTQTRALLEAFLNTSPVAKFSVSGRVVDEAGMPLSGVTMSLTGSQSTRMETITGGLYSFGKLATAGEYQIEPTKKHYSFQTRSVVRPNSDVVTDFTGIRLQHTISGRVVTTGAAPIAGATVVLSGDKAATTTSDANGDYSFANVTGGGNYTVTVSRQNYDFAVSSRSFTELSNNVDSDFQGSVLKYTIAGVVKRPDGTPLEGALVKLNGGVASTHTTDAGGNYSFLVDGDANYSVTIRHDPYFFEPAGRSFANLSANQRLDFQAGGNGVVISGQATNPKGDAMRGVSIALTGTDFPSIQTDLIGHYSFMVRPGANYTITPTKLPYTFDPVSTTITNITTDKVVNFKAHVNPGIPILVSGFDSARALAVDAVFSLVEPFSLDYSFPWSPDRRTRVVLHVENIDLSAPDSKLALVVELEDSSHNIYPLTVEYAAPMTDVDGTNRVVVRLNDNLTVGRDYLIRISYRGVCGQPLLIAISGAQAQN